MKRWRGGRATTGPESEEGREGELRKGRKEGGDG